MKLLCLDIPQPGVTPDQYRPHLLDEVRYAWELHRTGIIREIYARQDRPGVAIVVECASPAAAREAMAAFPLVTQGLIDWEIIPLGVFTGWEALWQK
ncbi:superoxide dismutase [Duganella sp. P38]|uniref:superoxide dismutase n=1 Tax=Duganella sp. P38 TaxID=3423949 RepID=UPI003D7A949F